MKKDKKGNTGLDNTGENNSGDWNSGDWNSGNWNSGDRNSGDRNSGNRNSGYWNSGDWNSGDWNSGYWNSGNWNSGYRNSGNWNSGNRNSGNRNSGNWNSGDRNSGCFNTNEPKARMFNRECEYTLTELWDKNLMPDFSDMSPCVWIESSMMTAEEKKANPSHETTEGYVKTLSYEEAWAVWKRKCTRENWQKVLALPNFDPEIFEEITGIKVEDHSESKKKAQELEDEAEKLIAKAKELRESL